MQDSAWMVLLSKLSFVVWFTISILEMEFISRKASILRCGIGGLVSVIGLLFTVKESKDWAVLLLMMSLQKGSFEGACMAVKT